MATTAITSIREMRRSGNDVVGDRPWGTHFCNFYESGKDLLDMLLSYFKAGLEDNEFCVWVVSEPLSERVAWDALRATIPDFDDYVSKRSIEVFDGRDWYMKGGTFDSNRVMSAWNEKLDRALDRGYAGLRGTGNTAWLQKKDWKAFSEYEQLVNDSVAGRLAFLLCTYSLDSCGANELLDVMGTHQFATARRRGRWELIETPELKQAKAEIKKMNDELEQRVVERTSQLTAVNEELTKEVLERQHAEEALRRAEKQVRVRTEELSLIIETIPGLVWCAAPDGELNYLNRRILDYTGTSPDAWAQLGWTNFLHPDDVEPTVSTWSRAVASGQPYDNQCRLRQSDGIYRWFQVLGQAARDNKGGVTRWYGLLIDIDDRKNMEDALRANERDLRLIVDTIPALVCTMTSRGKLESVNQQAIDYCGYAPTDSSAIHPDDIDRVNARWRHSVETGEPHDVDLRLRRFDGVYRWFHVRGLPLRDAEGHILRWYILLTDIEDRRCAEEALRSSETRLSRATQTATVGEFAAAIAHEINQPLAAVVANGHACLRWLSAQPPVLAKAQEAAERIVRDGTESGEVVRRIRALFKHAPLDKIDLDLNEVIAEVLRLSSGERTRRRVSVETDLDKDLGPVAGDRVQLQQVVFNLILNGIEAMDSVLDRPKKLFIRSKRHTPETVLVEIRDSGVGLKDPEKVFEAFFTTKENGMGMGLAVCRSIIDAHHGRLWAASGEDAGTTFSFTVPAATLPAAS